MRYLRSRSTNEDYDFFGSKTESWWATRYGRYTALESFTVIIELSPNQAWRVYIGGIPSSRIDKDGRQIYYALAGDGSGEQAVDDADFFLKLLSFLLNPYSPDVFQGNGRLLELEKRFDAAFDQSFIDGLDHKRHSDAVKQDIAGKLKELGAALPEAHQITTSMPPRPCAVIAQQKTVNQFLSKAQALKAKPDKLLTLAILNLPPTEEVIQAFWRESPDTDSLLLFTTYEGLSAKDSVSGLLFEMKQKKTPAPTTTPKPGIKPIVIAIVAALLLIIIVALIVSGGR